MDPELAFDAVEERRLQSAFEVLQYGADRRLSDVARFGSCRDRSRSHDGVENLDVTEIKHRQLLRTMDDDFSTGRYSVQ